MAPLAGNFSPFRLRNPPLQKKLKKWDPGQRMSRVPCDNALDESDNDIHQRPSGRTPDAVTAARPGRIPAILGRYHCCQSLRIAAIFGRRFVPAPAPARIPAPSLPNKLQVSRTFSARPPGAAPRKNATYFNQSI